MRCFCYGVNVPPLVPSNPNNMCVVKHVFRSLLLLSRVHMRNLHLDANLLPGANLHPGANLQPLASRSYANKLST